MRTQLRRAGELRIELRLPERREQPVGEQRAGAHQRLDRLVAAEPLREFVLALAQHLAAGVGRAIARDQQPGDPGQQRPVEGGGVAGAFE